MSMCLHLRFGTFKSNSPDAKESFCVLVWLSDDDAESFDLYDSVDVFLREYPDPFEFLLSLESTVMLENAESYCDPETGELTNIIAEGWPWTNNAEAA